MWYSTCILKMVTEASSVTIRNGRYNFLRKKQLHSWYRASRKIYEDSHDCLRLSVLFPSLRRG